MDCEGKRASVMGCIADTFMLNCSASVSAKLSLMAGLVALTRSKTNKGGASVNLLDKVTFTGWLGS